MATHTTRGVRIDVQSRYHETHSDPQQKSWFFSYTVVIRNDGTHTVQLLSRHWIIVHGTGKQQEVRGAGVVGEQPVLEPGESFEYTSYCQLEASMGAMHGTYQMEDARGETFDAVIPVFSLEDPASMN